MNVFWPMFSPGLKPLKLNFRVTNTKPKPTPEPTANTSQTARQVSVKQAKRERGRGRERGGERERLSSSVAPFFPFYWVAAPLKRGLPQKGFPFFPGSLNPRSGGGPLADQPLASFPAGSPHSETARSIKGFWLMVLCRLSGKINQSAKIRLRTSCDLQGILTLNFAEADMCKRTENKAETTAFCNPYSLHWPVSRYGLRIGLRSPTFISFRFRQPCPKYQCSC